MTFPSSRTFRDYARATAEKLGRAETFFKVFKVVN